MRILRAEMGIKCTHKCFTVLLALLAIGTLCLPLTAQTQSVTKILVTPAGSSLPGYSVDGQTFSQSNSFLWIKGSKHILSAPLLQTDAGKQAQYGFTGWGWLGTDSFGHPAAGSFNLPTITITADPAITEYDLTFAVGYWFQVVFFSCGGPGNAPPGVVTVNGTVAPCDFGGYLSGAVTVQAIPNPGYVFVGWASAGGQAVAGYQSIINVTQATTVYPNFAPAHTVNFATSPPGLAVLADRVPLQTPNAIDWGSGTTHTVGTISPQIDNYGQHWLFGSWSDSGAANHAYNVPVTSTAETLTATFYPAAAAVINTSPPGLNVTVDGKSTTGGTFTWGVGDAHTIAAPSQQTDSTGHVWGFAGWSNGGAQSQSATLTSDDLALGLRFIATYTPVGRVTVNSSIAGVSFTVNGSACATPCDVKQAVGSQIKIGATASVPVTALSRQDLAGWTGDATGGPGDLMVTLGPNPLNVTAAYRLMNQLSLGATPSNSVAWNVQPASSDGFYAAGAQVNVGLTPLAGFRFRNWAGDLSGAVPSGALSMTAPRNAIAMMDAVPYVSPAGVVNGAGVTPQSGVAPGSFVSIFGANLTPSTVAGPSAPLGQTLGGLAVSLSGQFMPLFFVSPSQINLQLPDGLPLGPATFTISAGGQSDVQATFTIVRDAPGLLQQSIGGQSFAVAFHADGSPISIDSPAKLGEAITLYGTGFGPTNPARPLGFPVPASPVYALLDTVAVAVGAGSAASPSAFALSGSVGVDAVQFQITDPSLSGTNASITLTIGGQASNTVLLPVQ